MYTEFAYNMFKELTESYLLLAHYYNIPALLDVAADAGFILLVPFAIYYCLKRR